MLLCIWFSRFQNGELKVFGTLNYKFPKGYFGQNAIFVKILQRLPAKNEKKSI